MDNDGWLDVMASGSVEERSAPIVFRNVEGTFDEPEGLGSHHYWVGHRSPISTSTGASMSSGWSGSPRFPAGGHWLEVSVDDSLGGSAQ